MEYQAFTATFSIYDAATRIELKEFTTTVWNRSEYRAKLDAQKRAKSYALHLSMDSLYKRYGLTAEQLDAMRKDGVIAAGINFYEVELTTFRSNPNPPERVGRKYAVKAAPDRHKAV